MKMQVKLIAVLFILVIPLWASSRRAQAKDPSPCAFLQEPQTDYEHLKVGITRKEVEKYFTQDGGVQFPSDTRYVYPKCRYLHVEVDFDAKGLADNLFSPDDKVINISKMYLDYLAKD